MRKSTIAREVVRKHIASRLQEFFGRYVLSTDVPELTARAMRRSDPIAWFESTPLVVSQNVLRAGGTVEEAELAAWRAREGRL